MTFVPTAGEPTVLLVLPLGNSQEAPEQEIQASKVPAATEVPVRVKLQVPVKSIEATPDRGETRKKTSLLLLEV